MGECHPPDPNVTAQPPAEKADVYCIRKHGRAFAVYDPAGTLVASDDNGAADGRNALLNYTALASGSYTIRVLAAAERLAWRLRERYGL